MLLHYALAALTTLALHASAQTTCQADTCMNSGVCVIVLGTPSCACPPGATGDRCETLAATTAPATDACLNDPCLNGGVCTAQLGDVFTCACAGGFIGSVCQVASTACDNSPCLNGGTCRPLTATTFECACTAGFGGPSCLPGAAAPTVAAPVSGGSCPTAIFNGCEKADVIFMVSYSRYDDRDDIDHEGDYLKGLIGEFQVDPDHVRVGVVVYHDTVRETIHLDDYAGDKAGLMNRIEVLTGARSQSHLNPSGNPEFSRALAFVKDNSFAKARPDAKKVIISIVHRLPDGDDYASILQTATALKADCTQIFVEAVNRDRYERYPYGGESTSLLQQVASSPVAPYYFKYSEFTDLENAAQRFNINCQA